MTDEELEAILPPLTPEQEKHIRDNLNYTNTDSQPKELSDVWKNIKPEDYWL